MTQPHNDYEIIRHPHRDQDLNRYEVICHDVEHENGQITVAHTITRFGARFAARQHFTQERVLKDSERYRVD